MISKVYIVLKAYVVLIQYQRVTDRQRGGQTDMRTMAVTAVCIALIC